MRRFVTLTAVAATVGVACSNVLASDARSIALGGAVIANGKGVDGVMANPASLMAIQRRGEKFHFSSGFNAEFRDPGDAIGTLTDSENENLFSDIEREVDILSNTQILCDLSDGSQACVTGTQALSDLSGRLLDIFDQVDDESIEGFFAGDFGMAFTQSKIPFAFNLAISVTGSTTPDIAAGDREYIAEFNTLLDGDSVTLDQITNAEFLDVSNDGRLGIRQPEDVLESGGTAGVVARAQFSVSMARSLQIGRHQVDFGITPKLSTLRAQSAETQVRDEFLVETESIDDRFNNSEVNETTITADIGASMRLPNAPVQVAAVIRNLIPESITTTDGFEFETTPQLILGASHQRGKFSVTGDLALNEAKVDGFSTQKIGVGIEYGTRRWALRGGIGIDAARESDSTALTLGFGLGPLQFGSRVTGSQSPELGLQLAFSF